MFKKNIVITNYHLLPKNFLSLEKIKKLYSYFKLDKENDYFFAPSLKAPKINNINELIEFVQIYWIERARIILLKENAQKIVHKIQKKMDFFIKKWNEIEINKYVFRENEFIPKTKLNLNDILNFSTWNWEFNEDIGDLLNMPMDCPYVILNNSRKNAKEKKIAFTIF